METLIVYCPPLDAARLQFTGKKTGYKSRSLLEETVGRLHLKHFVHTAARFQSKIIAWN